MAGDKKHAISKKQHRERAQPSGRTRFGLLEKHKDYVLRARDFHSKEDRLKILRRKAAERNPDEYYHSMKKAKTDKHGILIKERSKESSTPLSNDASKLLKTQDSSYIRTIRSHEKKKIEKLENSIGFLLAENSNDTDLSSKHTIFLDSEKEIKNFNPVKHFNTHPSLVNNKVNRLKIDDLKNKNLLKNVENIEKMDKSESLKILKELEKRQSRESELLNVESILNLQRELMKKGDKKKIVKSDGSITWKWKKERKR